MKEHRTKALRVTTTNNITRDSSDMFSSLQLLRLELDIRPDVTPLRCIQQPSDSQRCCKGAASYHHYQEPKTVSSMLQECVSRENVPMLISDLLLSNKDYNNVKSHQRCNELSTSASLYFTCSLPASVSPLFHRLCSNTSDFTRLCSSSQMPIQLLLTGDLQGNWSTVIDAVNLIVTVQKDRRLSGGRERNPLVSITDDEGNTPLLIAGRRLLKEGAFERATQLSRLLLEVGCDPNATNLEGRTLLTYSVHHMDDSVELTRTLLNAGATVWPIIFDGNISENHVSYQAECSAFTWFLRTVIRRRKLDDHCSETLNLLSEVMGEQPTRMHAHVMRTMFKHAKCYKVLGPVFYQLKMAMMRYWSQPQSLQFLSRKAIRSAVSFEQINTGGLKQLGLPNKIHEYLLLDD